MLDDAQATTSTTRIAYKLVGIDCAWRHADDYFNYLSRLQNYSESTLTSGLHQQFKIQGNWPIPRLGGWIRHGSQQ
jgi:hypothetical protein